MKYYYTLLVIIVCFLMSRCGKEKPLQKDVYSNEFSDSALNFLKTSLSKDDYAKLDLASLRILKNKKGNIAICIYEKGAIGVKFIMLHKSALNYDGNRVDLSQIVKTSLGTYNGEILLTTLQNEFLKRISVLNNKVIKVVDPGGNKSVIMDKQRSSKVDISSPDNPQVLDQAFVIGYFSSESTGYSSMYWFFNQYRSYESMYFDYMEGGGGGTEGTNNQLVTAPVFISPDHPIKNIVQDLKCFTINDQGTYSVSVNVNQPEPNTRDLTNLSAEHMAGHAFISMKEQFADGSMIIRNIGFYPLSGAKPGNGIDKSIFGDDSGTPYGVSLNISLSSSEFDVFRNAIYQQENKNYLLEGFNCTNSIITSFNAIQITLPSTIGANSLFVGNNPADLGQDIRELDLNKFSNQNGGRKVVRSVSNKNDITPPARKGGC